MIARKGTTLNGTRKSRRKLFVSATARADGRTLAEVATLPGADLTQADRALEPREELAALRLEQKELHQAISEAAQVQRKLCAPRELRRGEFEIAGEMFPARHLSGDFLKMLDLGPVIGLALADIAGKGLSAGLWLAHLIGLIHIGAREHSDPGAAVTAINRELCEGRAEPPLTALFFGRIDLPSGVLAYCNAGQPAALLLRRSGAAEWLQEGGPMLGAVREASFSSGRVTLDPDDTLITCSDGVVECRNSEDEEFGTRRLSAAAGTPGSTTARQALFSTLGAVLDFAGGRSPADDLTLMVAHRRAEPVEQHDRSDVEDSSAPHMGQAPGAHDGSAAWGEVVFEQSR